MIGESTNQNLSRIPPPPDEYSVRTMQSDIESLASSGGAGPQFVPMGSPTNIKAAQKKSDALITLLIFVTSLVVVGLAAYYFFFGS